MSIELHHCVLLLAYSGSLTGVWIAWYTGRVLYPARVPLQFSLLGLLFFVISTVLMLNEFMPKG